MSQKRKPFKHQPSGVTNPINDCHTEEGGKHYQPTSDNIKMLAIEIDSSHRLSGLLSIYIPIIDGFRLGNICKVCLRSCLGFSSSSSRLLLLPEKNPWTSRSKPSLLPPPLQLGNASSPLSCIFSILFTFLIISHDAPPPPPAAPGESGSRRRSTGRDRLKNRDKDIFNPQPSSTSSQKMNDFPLADQQQL